MACIGFKALKLLMKYPLLFAYQLVGVLQVGREVSQR